MRKKLIALAMCLIPLVTHAENALHLWCAFLDGDSLMREFRQSEHTQPQSFLKEKGYELMQDFPEEERQIWGTRLPTPQRAEVVVFISDDSCAYCEGYHINPATGKRSELWPGARPPYFDNQQKKFLNPTRIKKSLPIPQKIRTLNEFWVKQAGYRHLNTIIERNGLIRLIYVRELKWSFVAILVRYQKGSCIELRQVYAKDYVTRKQ